jgi:phosphatidylglycerophosphate synthase
MLTGMGRMIDGLFSHLIDPLWERPAKLLVRLGLSANQVTALGLVLVTANAAAYLWHGSALILGVGLSVAFAADALDGAVARLRNQQSAFGGYFDAMVDRYQEAVVLLAIALVTGLWLPAWLVLAGALFTSYAKARAAIEMPVANADWPDLLERLERIIILCALLICDGLVRYFWGVSELILEFGLWALAAGTNLTALQRMWRARRLLMGHDGAGPASAPGDSDDADRPS